MEPPSPAADPIPIMIAQSAKTIPTAATTSPDGEMTLKDAFKNDFHLGAALNLAQITGQEPAALAVVAKHFNSITPENILKWEEIHPEPDRYNFEAADRYVAFGEQHSMHIIGHTLVWWHQTPAWVFQDTDGRPLGREALLARMKEHIFTVMGRYRGRIHGWDVVNEAIAADGSWRKSRWYEILGEEHVAKAFEFAREADPQAELYYNDFDLENRPKCEGVIRLLQDLQARGLRVDGIGIQGHWFVEHPPLADIESHLVALGQLGLKLMITELDLSVLPYYPLESKIVDLSSFEADTQKKYNPYPDGLTDAAQASLARRYAELFTLFKEHRDRLGRITFWGVHDAQTWRNYWPIIGRTDHPLLFDRRCQPKPALAAVVKSAST
jgi:endo-1,4-beta-xylanase